MKKFLIATCSVIALSGALGSLPAVSEEGLSKDQQAKIDMLEKELARIKKAHYEKQGQSREDATKNAEADAEKLTSPLAISIKKMSAPPPPMTDDNPLMTALSAALPDDLKNNPLFKGMMHSVGGWSSQSTQLTNKVQEAPSALSAFGNLLAAGGADGGGAGMAKLICPLAEAMFGVPAKMCSVGFAAMGK